MGKHRREYAHTHAHTHQPLRPHSAQCSLHPKIEHTLGFSLHPAELSKPLPPQTHRTRASRTHPGSLLQTLAFRAYHCGHTSGPPTWIPTPTAPYMLVCMHTHITVTLTHTDSLTQPWSHIWIPSHTPVNLPHRHHCTPPEAQGPQSPLAPHAPTPAMGNTHIHTLNSHTVPGPQAA